MIDDVYQLALGAVRRHIQISGVEFLEEDGDLLLGGHRLGLSVVFDGFSHQADQTIAPLEVRIHLDGDEGGRFGIGTLGVGPNQEAALRAAVEEWHLLAASPVLAALGADAGSARRGADPLMLANWRMFVGRAGLRGRVPAGLQSGGGFYANLLMSLRAEVIQWPSPQQFELRSIIVMVSQQEGQCEVQSAVDGFVRQRLTESLAALDWPTSAEAYFYKQMFVLRHGDSAA